MSRKCRGSTAGLPDTEGYRRDREGILDRVSKEKRSEIMSKIRGSGTGMELALKPTLEALGFEYHPKGICGKPDFTHTGLRIAVFLDGCFWHGCPLHYREPDGNGDYWRAKIERNRNRDKAVSDALCNDGWRVIRVWEHELKGLLKPVGGT